MESLPEELLLIAYYENKAGALNSSLTYGLAGAVLTELLLRKRLVREGKHLAVLDRTSTGDAVLDETLQVVAAVPRKKSAKYWVNRLPRHIRNLKSRTRARLVVKGLLAASEERVLGVFPRRRFRLASPHTALAIKDRLRVAVFDRSAAKARDLALIGLIRPSGLRIFLREERVAAGRRFSEISSSDLIAKAVAETIADLDDSDAALIAASGA